MPYYSSRQFIYNNVLYMQLWTVRASHFRYNIKIVHIPHTKELSCMAVVSYQHCTEKSFIYVYCVCMHDVWCMYRLFSVNLYGMCVLCMYIMWCFCRLIHRIYRSWMERWFNIKLVWFQVPKGRHALYSNHDDITKCVQNLRSEIGCYGADTAVIVYYSCQLSS